MLRPGGKVYTITDVEELHQWIVRHFEGEEAGDGRELWERVTDGALEKDVCVKTMSEETEEGKKVTRIREEVRGSLAEEGRSGVAELITRANLASATESSNSLVTQFIAENA